MTFLVKVTGLELVADQQKGGSTDPLAVVVVTDSWTSAKS